MQKHLTPTAVLKRVLIGALLIYVMALVKGYTKKPAPTADEKAREMLARDPKARETIQRALDDFAEKQRQEDAKKLGEP